VCAVVVLCRPFLRHELHFVQCICPLPGGPAMRTPGLWVRLAEFRRDGGCALL
jgi:hypothetical protein